MGDIIAILGCAAAAFLLIALIHRAFAETSARPPAPMDIAPPIQAVLLHAIGLVAIALCAWQYYGEESDVLQILYEWNAGARESLPLLLINNISSVAAAYALYAHLRRSGLWRAANAALVAMSCLPFFPLGRAGGGAGITLLLQVLAYIALRDRRTGGIVFALAAQALDMRSIALLPVFVLLSQHDRRMTAGVFLMIPLFLAKIARGDFASLFPAYDDTYYALLGIYIPAALCILACALLCFGNYPRDMRLQWLLLLGGILPFMAGRPFLSFAFPLALSLQKSRLRFSLGLLTMLSVNALYIALRLFSPEVMHP